MDNIEESIRNRDGDRYPIRTVKSSGWKTAKRAPPTAPAPYKTDIIKEVRDSDIENYSINNDAGESIKFQNVLLPNH